MEVVGGIAREVQRKTEEHPVPGGESRRFEKRVFQVWTPYVEFGERVELHMLPLPDVRDGDEIVVVGDRPYSSGPVIGLAYDNRTRDVHGRHPWPFVRRTLECFGAIALLAYIYVLWPRTGAGIISLFILLAVAVGWLYVLAFELRCRKALSLAFTTRLMRFGLPIEAAVNSHDRALIKKLAVPDDPDVFLLLLHLLKHGDGLQRGYAAYALSVIKNPEAVPALLSNLSRATSTSTSYTGHVDGEAEYSTSTWVSDEPDERCEAAIKCGERAKIPWMLQEEWISVWRLARLVSSGDLDAETAVACGLGEIARLGWRRKAGSSAVEDLAAVDPHWFKLAASRNAVPALLNRVQVAAPEEMREIADILAVIGDPRTLKPLQELYTWFDGEHMRQARNVAGPSVKKAIEAIQSKSVGG